jgi:hypothetical protein
MRGEGTLADSNRWIAELRASPRDTELFHHNRSQRVWQHTILLMTGSCEHCGRDFQFDILHNGFGDTSYAYCGNCGETAILSSWSKGWPQGVKCTQAEVAPEMEAYLEPCDCGGRFAKGNSPRCPHCMQILSAVMADEYIEAQAPGAKKGWRWQRNWHDIYCAVIEGRKITDNFKTPANLRRL